jgi:hypothetical protein
MLELIVEESRGRTLLAVLPNDRRNDLFDTAIRFRAGTAEITNQDVGDPMRSKEPQRAAAE